MIEYINPWFQVVRQGHYYMIEEPAARNGAAVLPMVGECLLLLEQHRPAQGEVTLEIPRGYAEPGESALNCALRELHEETGLQASVAQMQSLGWVRPNTAILTSRVALYLAQLPAETQRLPSDEEASGSCWLPVQDIPQWLAEGRIEDGFTLAALGLFLGISNVGLK